MQHAYEASVVVCTRNRRRLLEENANSLLAQRHHSFEIIYVDGNSTDGAQEFLEQLKNENPDAVRVVETGRAGPGPARNDGVRIARGKYLLFLDDDATAPPDWIEKMLALRRKHDCEVLCGGVNPYATESPVERYLHYRMITQLGAEPRQINAAPTLNMLVERDAFDSAGGFRDVYLPAAEDWDLCYRLRQRGARIFFDPGVAVVHRYRSDRAEALQTIAAAGAAGVYVARLQGRNTAAYTLYSLLRCALSPLWVARRYPLGLYALALRAEWVFAASRARAYARMLAGKPVFQPSSDSE